MQPNTMDNALDKINSRTAVVGECREWQGADDGRAGYGVIKINGRKMYVHRLVHALLNNLDYDGEWETRHLCHNPRCCNPEHLTHGTRSDNQRDKLHNETFGKLFQEDIKLIRGDTMHTQRELARIFDVNQSQISRIKNDKTWGVMQ